MKLTVRIDDSNVAYLKTSVILMVQNSLKICSKKISLSGTVLSLSSPPAEMARGVSLAHAGEAVPTYG